MPVTLGAVRFANARIYVVVDGVRLGNWITIPTAVPSDPLPVLTRIVDIVSAPAASSVLTPIADLRCTCVLSSGDALWKPSGEARRVGEITHPVRPASTRASLGGTADAAGVTAGVEAGAEGVGAGPGIGVGAGIGSGAGGT